MEENDIVEEETTDESVNPTDAIADAQEEAAAIIAKAKADALAITDEAETDAEEVAKKAEKDAKEIQAKAKAKAKADASKQGKVKITPEPPKSPKDIVATGGEYRALRKCYFGIQLYEKGRILHTNKGDIIPHHFKKVVRMVEVTEEEE